MSWLSDLEDRQESLEIAHHEVEQAMKDQYLDRADYNTLSGVKSDLEEILGRTQEELELLNADWHLVEERADDICSLLESCIDLLVDAGLAKRGEEMHNPVILTMDDPPEPIADLGEFLNDSVQVWHTVREEAGEMINEGR